MKKIILGLGAAILIIVVIAAYFSFAPQNTVTTLTYSPGNLQYGSYQVQTPSGPQCVFKSAQVDIGVAAACP